MEELCRFDDATNPYTEEKNDTFPKIQIILIRMINITHIQLNKATMQYTRIPSPPVTSTKTTTKDSIKSNK